MTKLNISMPSDVTHISQVDTDTINVTYNDGGVIPYIKWKAPGPRLVDALKKEIKSLRDALKVISSVALANVDKSEAAITWEDM